MEERMKRTIFLVMAILIAFAIVSCDNGTTTKTTYTVTFDADGGTPTPPAKTVDKGKKVAEPTGVTNPGFILEGWYNGSTKWNFDVDTVSGNITLKANWVNDSTKVIVTFDPDGGTPTPQSQTLDIDAKVTAPEEVTKADYTLDGWYNGNTKWNFDTDTVSISITLKAKWVEPYALPEGAIRLGAFSASNGDTQKGWLTVGVDNNTTSTLTAEQLTGAKYIILDLSALPTGGMQFVWQGDAVSFSDWNQTVILENNGAAIDGITFVPTAGQLADWGIAPGTAKLLAIDLSGAAKDYDNFKLCTKVKTFICYYSSNIADLGLLRAYLFTPPLL